jgi:antitoxin VapB
MTRSTVSTSGEGQFVRLPNTVAFPDCVRDVDIVRVGNSRLISPRGRRWDDLFQSGPRVTDDFLAERVQRTADEREQF